MRIPAWIEPVPANELEDLHPLMDAVGKFIQGSRWLELWIDLAYGQLVEGVTDQQILRVDITTKLSTLAGLTHLIPEEHRAEYDELVAVATDIVAMRNGVVHGVSLPDRFDNPSYYQSQRRNKRGERKDVDYNREVLIAAGLKAFDVGGFIQANCGRWPHPNLDNETD